MKSTWCPGPGGLHAATAGRAAALRHAPWIGFVHTAASMREMGDLWSALADHAAPAFAAWGGPALPPRHRQAGRLGRRVVAGAERWPADADSPRLQPAEPLLEEHGRRTALCAYDWELATLGAPQRDLAELLCFVLPPDVPDATVDTWVERHRAAFERATGEPVDPAQWRRGFHAAMNDLLVNRLAMYALVHRVRRQPFLPRVVASWARIHRRAVTLASQ